jgi:hypothetical protein
MACQASNDGKDGVFGEWIDWAKSLKIPSARSRGCVLLPVLRVRAVRAVF